MGRFVLFSTNTIIFRSISFIIRVNNKVEVDMEAVLDPSGR